MIYLKAFTFSFLFALAVTPLVRFIALRLNFIAIPQMDRWHKKPTAIFGGVAIYTACLATFLMFSQKPLDGSIKGILLGATCILLLGIFDDFKKLPPQIKLVGQIMVASMTLILTNMAFGIKSFPFLALPITIVWVVAITNSFNLLDNMDGLACGIAGVCSFMLFAVSLIEKIPVSGLFFAILAGSCFGFLPFNFNPAKIFMGDAGSMFLGFTIANFAVFGAHRHVSSLIFTLVIPVLILVVPIFDTIFVTVIRRLQGRQIFQGGRDHTSHRLVSLGLSERKTVLLLYLLSIVFGLIAISYSKLNFALVSILSALTIIILLFFGIFLADIGTYDREKYEEVKNKKLKEGKVVMNTLFFYKRNIVEVLVDFVLICIAYYGSYLLRYEGKISPANLDLFMNSLSWVIATKLACFSYSGLYKKIWKYIGVIDLVAIFKAVSLSSILSIVFLTIFFRFREYSRVVFIIDWLLTLLLISGARILIRVMTEYFASFRHGEKRVIIIGAGDRGELILRELKRNKNLNIEPVGFIDNDFTKIGKEIHGTPVLGTIKDLDVLIESLRINEVILTESLCKEHDGLVKICQEANVVLKQIPGLYLDRNYGKN
jgi:UDP-GlcNAc:undecaprenyl-phosphate GlcNAc-1-phosphate transferase